MAAKEVLDLSKCNTSFGLDLFKKLVSSNEGGNVFFSPYSISSALAMTSLGAKNETLNQLRKALKLEDIPEKQAHKLFSKMDKSIMENSKKCTLHIANRLYGEKSYDFLKEFLVDCKECYGAGLEAVDFKNSSAGVIKVINEWVEVKTGGKIKDLVNQDCVNEFTRLILINAIYFKGDWNLKFDGNLTKEADFHVSESETVKVKMMHMRKAELLYGVDDNLCCQVLELPYLGKSLSMVILLPDLSKTTLEKMEDKLTPDVVRSLHVRAKEVFAWLPRFKLEIDFNLNDMLQALGIKDLFFEGLADLSGIDGKRDLFVSSVLHKAFIEVNEEGSEAAAATAVVISLRCALPVMTPEFRADHPFVFFIQDSQTKSILFYGRLVKP